MRRLIWILLAALVLTGCSTEAPSPYVTQPAESLPAVSDDPEGAAPTVDPLDLILADLSVEEKVGQLFFVSPEQLLPDIGPVTAMSAPLGEALSRYPVGGIILFADNILSPAQLEAFNQELALACGIGPFLAVDEEGGTVARVARNNAFDLPRYQSAASVGASGNAEDALNMGHVIGEYLKRYEFNLDFAPVADVNTNPQNPVIGNRAFSADPKTAARMAAAFTAGLNGHGIIGCYKHFPGHGDTAQDSHTGLAITHRTREEMENCEWIPFREAGFADFVMVGHIAAPEITGDMTPATLSYRMVTEILKGDLGFTGLVITDAMDMGAITQAYPSGEAAVAALQAGCDMILMPEDLPEAFEAVLAALDSGRLTTEWLDETVRRILEFKELHGIL